MSDFIPELRAQLEAQQADLVEKIRQSENNLLSLKETYLKVSGALEFADVLKEKADAEARDTLTAAGLAD
jgi:hypothetical protein